MDIDIDIDIDIGIDIDIYIYKFIYIYSGQSYLRTAMDMAKVGGPLSVVKVFAQI